VRYAVRDRFDTVKFSRLDLGLKKVVKIAYPVFKVFHRAELGCETHSSKVFGSDAICCMRWRAKSSSAQDTAKNAIRDLDDCMPRLTV